MEAAAMTTAAGAGAPEARELRMLRMRGAMLRERDRRNFDRLYGIAYGMTLAAGLEEAPEHDVGAEA